MKKKRAHKPLEINVAIYKCHVVIFFEADLKAIVGHGKRRGVETFTPSWIQMVERLLKEEPNGFSCEYGEENSDVLVWLKEYPRAATQYGVLYHELFHAVEFISIRVDDQHYLNGPRGFSEAKAFLLQYIFTEANKVLWV